VRKWVLPENIEDLLPAEAERVEALRRVLLDHFRARGYRLVQPPLVEHLDSLLTGTGRDLELQTFKVVDPLSGRLLGVRADITPQVARIDAHLLNEPGLTRLCYCGSVLRTFPAGIAQTREVVQIGAELYGEPGIAGDREVLALLLSSLAAAGPARPGQPRREADPASPISAYGRSKLAGEEAIRRHCGRVPSVIVRPPIVYGPGDHELIPTFLPMLKAGVLLKSGWRRKAYSLVHVADLCDALVAAAERGRTLLPDGAEPERGVYFVSDGAEHTWDDVCRAMARAWGKPGMRILPLPEWAGYPALAALHLRALLGGPAPALTLDKLREMAADAWTCAADRAAEELGFQPAFPLEHGLQETLAWFRRAGSKG